MDDFRIIYRILKMLQRAMDYDEGADPDLLSANALGITQNKLKTLWSMLAKNGYVEGVEVRSYLDCADEQVFVTNPKITLKGLEYLHENSLMKKAADIAVGIIERKL